MLIAIDKPVGIDFSISQLQTKLHANLLASWGITSDQYLCYGRCSKVRTPDGGYAAEVRLSSGEYQDVYFDDHVSAVSFFSIADKQMQPEGQGKVAAALIYFVDLSKLKPLVQHRADEEVRIDVLNLIGYSSFGFATLNIETGIDNVLKEYPGSRRDKRLASLDMGSKHAFRINFNLIYQNQLRNSKLSFANN